MSNARSVKIIGSTGNISKAGWRYCMSLSCLSSGSVDDIELQLGRVVGMATLPADPWVGSGQ